MKRTQEQLNCLLKIIKENIIEENPQDPFWSDAATKVMLKVYNELEFNSLEAYLSFFVVKNVNDKTSFDRFDYIFEKGNDEISIAMKNANNVKCGVFSLISEGVSEFLKRRFGANSFKKVNNEFSEFLFPISDKVEETEKFFENEIDHNECFLQIKRYLKQPIFKRLTKDENMTICTNITSVFLAPIKEGYYFLFKIPYEITKIQDGCIRGYFTFDAGYEGVKVDIPFKVYKDKPFIIEKDTRDDYIYEISLVKI